MGKAEYLNMAMRKIKIKIVKKLFSFGKFYVIIQLLMNFQEEKNMKHVQTLNKASLKETAKHGGCGECQTSCQSACKTSCTVANQKCEKN